MKKNICIVLIAIGLVASVIGLLYFGNFIFQVIEGLVSDAGLLLWTFRGLVSCIIVGVILIGSGMVIGRLLCVSKDIYEALAKDIKYFNQRKAIKRVANEQLKRLESNSLVD